MLVHGAIEEWWMQESLDQSVPFRGNELPSIASGQTQVLGINRPTKDPETASGKILATVKQTGMTGI